MRVSVVASVSFVIAMVGTTGVAMVMPVRVVTSVDVMTMVCVTTSLGVVTSVVGVGVMLR